MKKILLSLLLIAMFIPFVVNAKTCDTDKISISSISLKEKSDNVEELNEATTNGNNIILDLSMSEVGDNIKYKIAVKNDSNEDYELDKNSFNISSNYIDYILESDDNSNIVKANSSKTVYLKLEYKNQVPEDSFESGTYNDNKTMTVNLSTDDISVLDILKNPETGVQSYILITSILLLISGSLYALLKKRKYAKFMILIIGTTIIVPLSVSALCKTKIVIDSKVSIVDINYVSTMYGVYSSENQLYLNQTIPNTVNLRLTPNDAMNDWESLIGTTGATQPFYLKHKVQNNIVKGSNVVFMVSEQMASSNPGMKVGIYELIGGFATNDSETLEYNRNTMFEAFDYEHYPSRCYKNSTGDHCVVDGLHVNVYNLGVFAADSITYETSRECIVYYTGNSFCK